MSSIFSRGSYKYGQNYGTKFTLCGTFGLSSSIEIAQTVSDKSTQLMFLFLYYHEAEVSSAGGSTYFEYFFQNALKLASKFSSGFQVDFYCCPFCFTSLLEDNLMFSRKLAINQRNNKCKITQNYPKQILKF